MGERTDEIFEAIIGQAIEKANDVDCSPQELTDAFRSWVEKIELEIDEVESTTR